MSISVQEVKESDVRKFTSNEWYTFSWVRCTYNIIIVVANKGVLFNKCYKMLYFCKKIISFPTYFSSISRTHHLLDVTLCLWRVFGAHYPLRHWLPLTVQLPLTRRINYDSSKRKVEQISFRKYSCCDSWRVTDMNSIYTRHVKTCLTSIATNKGADQPACAVWTASIISLLW